MGTRTAGARPTSRDRSAVGLKRARKKKEGIALLLVLGAVFVLNMIALDLANSTTTAYVASTSRRDALKAEFLAKSSIDLTRLLVVKEPLIRQPLVPLLQMATGREPPQIPVYKYADWLLSPFCRFDSSKESLFGAGVDVGSVEGLGNTGGTCEVRSGAENAKLNLNQPLIFNDEKARKSMATLYFALLHGHDSPNPYDVIFEQRDADDQFTDRPTAISAMIDFWDPDTTRTNYDPGSGVVTSTGPEDDPYSRYRDPYRPKNAAFDSLEELRLVRGMSDDFWATFIQPDPEDPTKDLATIYGSGALNPNEAEPLALLARVCGHTPTLPICRDVAESLKFITLLNTVRAMAPIPLFSTPGNFLDFLEGKGGERDLYPLLRTMLGDRAPAMLFVPASLDASTRAELEGLLATSAKIITIQSTGIVGNARVTIRSVVNFHDRWSPPPPNAGSLPGLGVFHYYRIE